MKRILNPATNPAGWSAALALAYALAQAAVNVHAQHKALTAPVVVAIAGSVLAGWIRGRVTPVADPKDGSGNPLAPSGGKPGLVLTQEEMDAIRQMLAAVTVLPVSASGTLPTAVQLGDPERRRAEDMRLMFAPGTPSFYPYPGEQEAPSPSGTPPPAVQPPATTTGAATS